MGVFDEIVNTIMVLIAILFMFIGIFWFPAFLVSIVMILLVIANKPSR